MDETEQSASAPSGSWIGVRVPVMAAGLAFATMSASSRPRREVLRPSRPRRVRRSGGRGWTRERIADALRAWADELGRAPRSYDWAPATARAGGFALAG